MISKENIRLDCYLLLKYCRRQCTLLPLSWAKSLTKFNPKTRDFKCVLDLNCKPKEGLNNLDFSIRFQMLKIYYFEMALNTCEMWSNGIKIAVFSKKIQKNRPAAGGFVSRPPSVTRLNYSTTSLLKHVSQFRHLCTLGICLSPLLERVPMPTPGHGFWSSILRYLCHTQKIPLSKFLMTSVHVICGLPPSNRKSWQRLCCAIWHFSIILIS